MKAPNERSLDEMRAHLIDKAADDETFRGQLLSDPRTSIEGELGITIPEGLAVQVHENSAEEVHLVLPPATKLSEAELSRAAGGATSGWCCY